MPVTRKLRSPYGSGYRYRLFGATVLMAGVLLISLVYDLVPRFHLGDSATFLLPFYPDNRSWTYGHLAQFLLCVSGQLESVAIAQILLWWASFLAFSLALVRSQGLKWWPVGALVWLAGTLEPLGYFWSRSFMSDSTAQSVFVLLISITVEPYFPAIARLIVMPVLCFILISLRVIYYPPLLFACGAVFMWEVLRARTARWNAMRSWGILFVALLFGYYSYAEANRWVTEHNTASVDYGDMAFLTGALSPLMADELNNIPLTPEQKVELPPLDYSNRLENTFAPQGLVPAINGRFQSAEAARGAMEDLLIRTVLDHPVKFLLLVLRQWSDYLNPAKVLIYHWRGYFSGAIPYKQPTVLPGYLIRNLSALGLHPPPKPTAPSEPSLALTYFEKAGGIYALLLAWYATLSIVIVFFVNRLRYNKKVIFLNIFAFLYMGTIALGANEMVTRYLLPLDAPLMFTAVEMWAVRAGRIRRGLLPSSSSWIVE